MCKNVVSVRSRSLSVVKARTFYRIRCLPRGIKFWWISRICNCFCLVEANVGEELVSFVRHTTRVTQQHIPLRN